MPILQNPDHTKRGEDHCDWLKKKFADILLVLIMDVLIPKIDANTVLWTTEVEQEGKLIPSANDPIHNQSYQPHQNIY